MKRSFIFFLAITMVMMIAMPVQAAKQMTAQIIPISIYMGGEKLSFSHMPLFFNHAIYVPLRQMAEKLGYSVSWDASKHQVSLSSTPQTDGQQTISNADIVKMDATEKTTTLFGEEIQYDLVCDGETMVFDEPVIAVSGIVYVPIRDLAEYAGFTAESQDSSQLITLTPKQIPNGDDLTPFCQNDKWGYIDKKGNVIIKPRFYAASYFHEGLAAVDGTHAHGGYGYINPQGKVVIACQSDWDNAYDFQSGIARVSTFRNEDTDNTGNYNNYYRFIDKKGNMQFNQEFSYASDFSEGFASVITKADDVKMSERGSYRYIDAKGNVAVDQTYVLAGSFSDGVAVVMNQYKEVGLMNNQFKMIVPYNTYESMKSESNGFIAVLKDGKWGFVNKEGNLVIPCQYSDVKSFSQNLACVQSDGKYGFINKTGAMVIPAVFTNATSFSEGVACVMNADGLCGAIDLSGSYVIHPIYYGIWSCHNGLLKVHDQNENEFYVTKTGEEIRTNQ